MCFVSILMYSLYNIIRIYIIISYKLATKVVNLYDLNLYLYRKEKGNVSFNCKSKRSKIDVIANNTAVHIVMC